MDKHSGMYQEKRSLIDRNDFEMTEKQLSHFVQNVWKLR